MIELLGRGMSNAQIAQELFISADTVRTHLNRSATKARVRGRTALVSAAYRHGALAAPVSARVREELAILGDALGRVLAALLWLERDRVRAPEEVPRVLESARHQVVYARGRLKEMEVRRHVDGG